MTRPSSLSNPSNATTRPTRKLHLDDRTLFNRRFVKHYLRASGRKHAITMAAFKTVTRMGQATFARIVQTVVRELSQSVRNNRTTITTRHIVHAANMLGLSSTLIEEAIGMHRSRKYDESHYKKSAVRRNFAQYSSKNRVSASALSLLWCIVILHIQEVITYNTDLAKPGVNMRIKVENIFSAIHGHSEGVLDSFKSFIGTGISLGATNV